jgi:polyhydroxybutyrate depolymerase
VFDVFAIGFALPSTPQTRPSTHAGVKRSSGGAPCRFAVVFALGLQEGRAHDSVLHMSNARLALWLVLAAATACGDAVTGTTHRSPPLPAVQPPAPSAPVGTTSPSTPPPASPDAGAVTSTAAPFTCPASSKKGGKGDSTLTLTSGGLARDSVLHVPPSYDPAQGAMLVINYHGFSSNGPEQVLLTGMNAAADAKGFIVAYPDGVGNGWNAGSCCSELQPPGVDDVQFTKDLLSLIESEYCVDPKRIFATGFSNGGFMSHMLGCEMADTFAAIAPVSGVLGIPPTSCLPSRPVPVLDIHGTADPVVPYDGGPALKLLPPIQFASVDATVGFWRSANSCLSPAVVDYANGDATCLRWGDCNGGVEVELCTLVGDGHQWPDSTIVVPGLGNESKSIDATSFIIDWFMAHPGT